MGKDDIVHAYHGIPELRPEVRLVFEQELCMPVGIGVRSRISWVFTNTVFAPDDKGPGRSNWVDTASVVRRKGIDRGLKVWKQPRRDFLGVPIAQEAECIKPPVERYREWFNGQGAR